MTDHSALIERLEAGPQSGCAELPGWEELCAEAAAALRDLMEWRDMAADLMRVCTTPERFEEASTLQVYARMRGLLATLPSAPNQAKEGE